MFKEVVWFGFDDGYIFLIYGCQGLLGNMILGGLMVDLIFVEFLFFEQVVKLMFMELLWFWVKVEGFDGEVIVFFDIKLI